MLLQGIELLLVFLKLLFEGSFQQLKGGLQGAVLVILFLGVAAKEEEEGYKEKPDSAPRFFRSGKAGEWRHELTPDQVRKIVQDHHVQMARFGYLIPELRPLLPGGPLATSWPTGVS